MWNGAVTSATYLTTYSSGHQQIHLDFTPTSDTVVSALRGRAAHPSELVREHVAWALSCHAGPKEGVDHPL